MQKKFKVFWGNLLFTLFYLHFFLFTFHRISHNDLILIFSVSLPVKTLRIDFVLYSSITLNHVEFAPLSLEIYHYKNTVFNNQILIIKNLLIIKKCWWNLSFDELFFLNLPVLYCLWKHYKSYGRRKGWKRRKTNNLDF